MSNENQTQPGGHITRPSLPQTAAKAAPPKGKGKGTGKKSNTGIKALIAGLSVAATIGGWGLMAQNDATTAAQAALDQSDVAALVSQDITQQSSDALATAIATATATATFPTTVTSSATATSTVTEQAAAGTATQTTATNTPVPTNTPQPTDTPEPTATAVPTAAPQRIITTTRSSK